MAASHPLPALFAKQDSRKVLPTFFLISSWLCIELLLSIPVCFLQKVSIPACYVCACRLLPKVLTALLSFHCPHFVLTDLIQPATVCCSTWTAVNAKELHAFQHLLNCLHWRSSCGLVFSTHTYELVSLAFPTRFPEALVFPFRFSLCCWSDHNHICLNKTVDGTLLVFLDLLLKIIQTMELGQTNKQTQKWRGKN